MCWTWLFISSLWFPQGSQISGSCVAALGLVACALCILVRCLNVCLFMAVCEAFLILFICCDFSVYPKQPRAICNSLYPQWNIWLCRKILTGVYLCNPHARKHNSWAHIRTHRHTQLHTGNRCVAIWWDCWIFTGYCCFHIFPLKMCTTASKINSRW